MIETQHSQRFYGIGLDESARVLDLDQSGCPDESA
jgi:hypothetical protein